MADTPRAAADRGQTIAIINGLQDTIEMLEVALQHAGFRTIAAQARDVRNGIVDLPALCKTHRVAAMIYDIAIPYDENWKFLVELRGRDGNRLPPIVVTTTNQRVMAQLEPRAEFLEIIGKPYDLALVVAAVVRAAGEPETGLLGGGAEASPVPGLS
jgi:DNA-binding NtrC family response regulator